MAANVVEILVKATDGTKEGFDSSKAGAEATAGSMEELAAAQDKAAEAETRFREAQAQQNEALAHQEELQKSGTASADELAAAQDRVTEATLRSLKAQEDLAAADARVTEAQRVQGAATEETATKTETSGGLMAAAGSKVKMAALGVAVGMGLAVKAAGDFQDSTTHLVTDAGESAKNLGMVQQGILAVSAATGTSAKDITDAMYHIESGGYHGAAGLQLLKIAAEGAKVGGASLDTVSKTLVGTMNAYGLSASHSASFMNQLIATVGAGDMRMQDLASSLSNVAPLAAKVGLSFAQVGGAIATMTAQGMSAQQSTQDLSNAIRSLSNPNNVAINEMQQLGLNSQDVSKNLGERGLTGTIGMLTKAITDHMGPSGMVIQSAFNNATNAAKDANTMIAAMPANLQALAKGFLDGSISSKAWRTDLQGLDPVQAHLMTQFAGTAEKAHSFNSLLASGSPAAQTYTAALAKMMGGATGLNTALMLTGSNAAVFQRNVGTISDAAKKAGGNVDNWSTIQGTFNFKLQQAKASVEDMGISLGSALLPAVTAILGPVTHMLALIAGNKVAAEAFAVVVGGVLAGALGVKLVGALSTLKGGISGVIDVAGKIPSAISSIGSFASSVASNLAKAVTATAGWIAEHAVATAQFIAQNVAQAASATAAFVAENAATLGIVALIGLLIAAIVYLALHWRTVWRDIKDVALDAWHFIDNDMIHPLMHGIDTLVHWVESHWRLLATILATVLLGPVGGLIAFIATHWAEFRRLTSEVVDDVVGFFERLPGRIMGAIAALPSMLYNAGRNIISMLAHGISDAIGAVTSAIGNIGSEILSHLPFSPAKKGPLSGSGSPDKRGFTIARMLAEGLTSGTPWVQNAMARLAGSAGLSGRPVLAPAGGFGAYGGQLEITLRMQKTGNRLLDDIMEGIRVEVRNKGGGGPQSVQKTFGRTW